MEIFKGRLIPPRKTKPRLSKYDISEQMEVGDCLVTATYKEMAGLRQRLTYMGKKCVTRKLDEEGFGIWRTE
tara:strand:- start:113 stop:328 length:216 start_codon:yes stop_codon:yes gene_type:complete